MCRLAQHLIDQGKLDDDLAFERFNRIMWGNDGQSQYNPASGVNRILCTRDELALLRRQEDLPNYVLFVIQIRAPLLVFSWQKAIHGCLTVRC